MIACKYGSGCYRTSAAHRRQYSHPPNKKRGLTLDRGGDSDDDEADEQNDKPRKRKRRALEHVDDDGSGQEDKSEEDEEHEDDEDDSQADEHGLFVVKGNLLQATEQFIAHQCNCMTPGATGVAKQIFAKHPLANVYKGRKRTDKSTHDKCGTLKVRSNIIAMFAQYLPGKGKPSANQAMKRLAWFKQCLKELTKLNIQSVAMPYKIGCGAAGGDWPSYKRTLERFAIASKIKVVLYRI